MPSRRDLLRGALGATALAPFGLSALPRAAALGGSARRIVLVTAFGGWDTTVVLDPKRTGPAIDGPDLDEDPTNPDDREAVTTFGALSVGTNLVKRPAVSAFFEAWAPRTLIARGIDVGTISHQPARGRIATGRREEAAPDLAALAADRHGRALPLPYVDLGSTGRPGPFPEIAVRTGAIGQARFLLDRRLRLPEPDGGTLPHHTTATAVEGAARTWLAARADALAAQEIVGRGRGRLDAWGAAWERAVDLTDGGPRIASLLPSGLQRTLDAQADAAVSLLDDGLAWCVGIDSTLDFDTHATNADQHARHDTLFAGLARLLDGLDAASLLDDTLVVVLSEFGRTPRRNEANGKDHWPVTSAMLLGGGVRGGRSWGATDDRQGAVPVDLASGAPDPAGTVPRFDHLIAGVLAAIDVDPGPWLPGVEVPGGLMA